MGRPAPRAPLLLLPLLATAQLLAAAPRAGASRPSGRLRVTANFECKVRVDSTLPTAQCRRQAQDRPALSQTSLALSTAQMCQAVHSCQPCMHVRLTLDTAGLRSIQSLQLHFLVLDSNQVSWLEVQRRGHDAAGSLWQVELDCVPVESGRRVLVSLGTIPDQGLRLNQSYLVPAERAGPTFSYTWLPEVRAIEVVVPKGPNQTVRLCHLQLLECAELPDPFHQEVLVSGFQPGVLRYEFLLPCLCIEASFLHHDSLRTKLCPFQDQPAAYGTDLWASMHFHDYSTCRESQMAMVLNTCCPLRLTATLCWKESDAGTSPCHSFPNSTAMESDQERLHQSPQSRGTRGLAPLHAYLQQTYTVEKVDVHPLLCFKFSYGNSSHVECPHRQDTAWNVSVSIWFLQLLLHITSAVPASFSAALCQPQQGQCEPELPIHTVTCPESFGPQELTLLLPVRILGGCVLVWRSDVQFARKQLLCPDVTHRHFGLFALGLALALGLLLTILLCNCRSLRKLATAPQGCRPILLIYSPDSEEHKSLVCALADVLHSALGCDVRLDLWETGSVGRLGPLPWFYAQRELVSRQQGTVLLLWSRGSTRLYQLWLAAASGSSNSFQDPHDLFGAAMSCLQGELQGSGQLGDWALAYFGELCSRRDVPPALGLLPCYRLPRELPSLAGALQSSTRHFCWLQPNILLHRLLMAEKKKGLQGKAELGQLWRPKEAVQPGCQVQSVGSDPLSSPARPALQRSRCT